MLVGDSRLVLYVLVGWWVFVLDVAAVRSPTLRRQSLPPDH